MQKKVVCGWEEILFPSCQLNFHENDLKTQKKIDLKTQVNA